MCACDGVKFLSGIKKFSIYFDLTKEIYEKRGMGGDHKLIGKGVIAQAGDKRREKVVGAAVSEMTATADG